MNDWKSALKALKKEMFGAKDEGSQPKSEPINGASFVGLKSKNKLQQVARSPSSKVGMKDILAKFQNSNQPPKKGVQQAEPPKVSSPNAIRT